MHLRARSSDSDALDWLLSEMQVTLWPRMPPVALTCLKYASEPQLSVSPICAYGPARASSLQTTMGALLLAAFPPPLEPQAASPPAARMMAAVAAALNEIRLRTMVLPSWELHCWIHRLL